MKIVKQEEKCMSFSVRLFRVVGCWPKWEKKKNFPEQLYFLFAAFIYSVLFVYTFILAYGLTVHYKAWNSLEEAIEDLIVFATGFIVLLKITLVLWNRNRLQNIIDYINNDLNKRQLLDEEDRSVIRACVKHEKSLTKIYIFFGYCITILYTASSIIRILRSSGVNQYTLPLKYPFYPRHFPLYHIAYFHQLIVMILNGHIGTLVDSFFSCLTYYLCGHFKIIENRIAKENGIITKNFVSYHNEMIGLVKKLQAIFGSFLMFQLISNSLLICLGLLQITQTKNIKFLHYIKCLIYVTIKLSQMFLYCWYGEEMIKKSSSIAFGAYSGRWHDPEVKNSAANANNLRMVLLRAQKPITIKAGAFFILSVPTLTKVVNTAYSFFTMIKSTQKNK